MRANPDARATTSDFDIVLVRLVKSSLEGAKRNTRKVVGKVTRNGAKYAREKAASGIGVTPWSEKYTKGFAAHVETRGDVTRGEIGNRAKPGLVHLLEDGHSTLNGGRTRSFPHMGPTRDEVERELRSELPDAIGEGLME